MEQDDTRVDDLQPGVQVTQPDGGPMLDDRAPAPYGAEATPTTGVPCKHCGGPVPAPRRKGVVKDFCQNKCRAAYRDARIRAAIQEAGDAIRQMTDQMEVMGARLAAALAQLDQFRGGKKKERKGLDTV